MKRHSAKANSFCALFARHHFSSADANRADLNSAFCGKYSFEMLRWFRPAKQLSASGSNGG
jgi:hypothetical protein